MPQLELGVFIKLTEWINLHEFAKLDSAICVNVNGYRANILRAIKHSKCLLNIIKKEGWLRCSLYFYCWLSLRIDIDSFNISSGLFAILNRNVLSDIAHYQLLTPINGQSVLNLFKHVKGLKIENLSSEFDMVHLIDLMGFSGEILSELHLTDALPHDRSEIINAIAAYCPNIQKIDISKSTNVSEQSVINVCMYCKNITELNVSNCPLMGARLIECIVVHCDNLVSLDIRNCDKIKKNEIMILAYYHRRSLKVLKMTVLLSDYALAMLIHHAGIELHTLHIPKKDNSADYPFITDKSLLTLKPDRCPNLTILDITNHKSVSEHSIASICQSYPLLQSLEFGGIANAKDRYDGVNINNTTATAFHGYFSVMPSLTKLVFDHWKPVLKLAAENQQFLLVRAIASYKTFNTAPSTDFADALIITFTHKFIDICKSLLGDGPYGCVLQQVLKLFRNDTEREADIILLVEYLLQRGADVNSYDEVGYTPLLSAIWSRLYKVVAVLLKAGADYNKPDKHMLLAPLMLACSHDSVKCVEMLLKCPSIDIHAKNKSGHTVTKFAFKSLFFNEIDVMLTFKGVKWVDTSPTKPKAESLFNKYASGLNYHGLLEMVEREPHTNFFSYVDKKLLTALAYATIGYLFFEKYRHMGDGEEPSIEVLSFLIQKGCNINHQDQDGRTVLHYCVYCESDSTRLLSLFLHCGADINIKDYTNRNAVMVAKALHKSNQLDCFQKYCKNTNIPFKSLF